MCRVDRDERLKFNLIRRPWDVKGGGKPAEYTYTVRF